METCFNYCDTKKGFFSSDEQKWINRIKKLKEQYPEEIKILASPETNDGCIYCKLPTSWLKISPPRKLNMTEEQKTAAVERLRSYRQTHQQKKTASSEA